METAVVKALLFLCLIFLFSIVKIHASSLVSCETTKGSIELEIYHEWAPIGAKRFIELVKDGFFQEISLFRCVPGFLTQFGISDRPEYQHWHEDNIPDDSNLNLGIKKNFLSFAGGGPNTRSTQLFIAVSCLYTMSRSLINILMFIYSLCI